MGKKLQKGEKKKEKERIYYPQEERYWENYPPDDIFVPYIPSNPPENTKNKKRNKSS